MALDGTPIIVKKKKAHHEAHHGGSWKVAYADFVTAMMAFFMVLWIMGLSDSTRTQVAGYFSDPLGFTKTPPNSRSLATFMTMQQARPGQAKPQQGGRNIGDANTAAIGEKIAEKIKADPKLEQEKKQIRVESTAEGVQIQFLEGRPNTFFRVGSAEITDELRDALAYIAPVLIKGGVRFRLQGHTDSRQYPGTDYDNWDLSLDRARAFKRELQSDGIDPKQFLSIDGLADTKPLVPGDTMNPNNRRVAILIPWGEAKDIPESMLPKSDAQHIKDGVSEDIKPKVELRPTAPDIQNGN